MSTPAARLPPCPPTVEDAGGAPRFGTWQGSLDAVDLSRLRGAYQPGPVDRLRMHKKWLYGFVATREVAALFAVVDLGYSSNAFAMAVDLSTGQVLADKGLLGPPRPLVLVNDHPNAGLEATFLHLRSSWRSWRAFGDERFHAAVHLKSRVPLRPSKLCLDCDWLAAGGPPALTVIAPVDGGVVNVTQKWAGLQTFGTLEAGGRRYSLDGGIGGLDYTHGYLARQTSWRWAFVCSRLADGTPFGINLVEGFNESRDDVNENAIWVGNRLIPVGRARFEWNRENVLDGWKVKTVDGVLDLAFTPLAAHQEVRDLKLIKSAFKQPVGHWRGTMKLDGVTHELRDAPGVAEDQSVLW